MAEDRDPLYDEDEQPGMLGRILPPLVLISAFGGFIALAIYAYQAGTQSVGEGDLVVVEADKTPMKEKPEDPGGMQFPNQDKTIFETIAGGKQQQPKVERVLPTPEEPMAKDKDVTPSAGSDNAAATPAGVEQVFTSDDSATPAAATAAPVVEKSEPKVVNVQEELGKQAVAENTAATPAAPSMGVVAPAAPVDIQSKAVSKAEAKHEAPKPVEKIETAQKPVTLKPAAAAKPVEKPKASTGKALVQLGAYKSEAEARADFAKIQKKNAALAGKSPAINRADLGAKGVFYRLRVATDDAKSLCAKLAAGGQACMVVK